MKHRRNPATWAAVLAAFWMVFASPASAMDAVGYHLAKHPSPGGTVTGLCTFVTDVPDQSFDAMTILVKYEVTADAPAYAVNGICAIKDMYGVSYGSVVAGAPGMAAANAGTVVVPRDIKGAKSCQVPEALWPDGTEANPRNLAYCKPL